MSFDFSSLLGLPLSMAEARLNEGGLTLPVTITSDPHGREAGTLRVIRADGNGLVAAAFLDGMPMKKTSECAGSR